MSKTSTLIRIDSELLEQLRTDANNNERSLNSQIVYILKKYIENKK